MNKQNLWVGIGCQRGTSIHLLEKAIQQVFKENQLNQSAIAGIATIDHKAKEVCLLEFCKLHNLTFKTFPAEILRLICVPNPAKITEQAMGTPSVAEAAAILAAADINYQTKILALKLNPALTALGVRCLVAKQIFRLQGEPGAVTVAVAQGFEKMASVIQPRAENS